MNFETISSKRPFDQQTHVQQALRRLKYLHTSLANPSKTKASKTLKPLQTTSTPPPINGLDLPGDEERVSFEDQTTTDKRCFLALTPQNEFNEEFFESCKLISRQRCGWRPVRKGRAPFASPTACFNPTFHPLSTRKESPWDRKTREVPTQRKTSTKGNDRKSKSAPASGGLPILNPEQFDCVQCFANEMERLQKVEGPEFNTNMNIKRVNFSARPRPKETPPKKYPRTSTKLISEKTFKIPQSLYGGWGIRTRRRNTELAQKYSRHEQTQLDVASEFQALRIEARGEGWGKASSGQESLFPPPPAPPTPVRQIDIKIPEGYLVQYRLQSVA